MTVGESSVLHSNDEAGEAEVALHGVARRRAASGQVRAHLAARASTRKPCSASER